MKTLIIIGLVLFLPFISPAQSKDCCDKDCCPPVRVQPTITKGYYSIGNNAQKLARVTMPECCDYLTTTERTVVQPTTVTKGYYSIGKNEKKLQAKGVAVQTSSAHSAITKGYYSIGNNNKKLNNSNSQVQECCPCPCN